MSDSNLPSHIDNNTSDNAPDFGAQLDSSFAKIDWHAPWLSHLSQLDYLHRKIKALSATSKHIDITDSIEPVADDDGQADIVARVLNTASTQQSKLLQTPPATTKATTGQQAYTLNFVSQNALPDGEGYEHFIATTGNIPTRDNLHDLFNGSIWLTFPKTKALLNYYHMLEISKYNDEHSHGRGRVRDTITVFDENGAILVTSDAKIGQALIHFDWQGSLVTPRAQWDNPNESNKDAQAVVYIFGHALLEQLIQPRKPLCAHSVIINVAPEFFALATTERMTYLDSKLADYMDELLSQDKVTPRQLSPLPILGVPHFWAANANPEFYEDSYVFRNGRRQKKA